MSKLKEITGPAAHHGPSKGTIAMVAANPATSKQTGWPIGCWAAELTHPFQEFVRAGYDVIIASPAGGKVEFDGYSDPTHESGFSANDLLTLGFMKRPDLMKQLDETPAVADLDAAGLAAVFLVGGQSPMYTFRGNEGLMKFFSSFYESGRPSAAVCHATAMLLDTPLSDGTLLVKGKTWTGFADGEEKMSDETVGQRIQPFWIETEARKLEGTTFTVKPPFTEYAVRDGNLITGQQQNSGVAAARLVIDALESA